MRAAYSDAAVGVYELAGDGGGWRQVERRLPYSRDFDPDLLLLDNYIPLHTLLAERELWLAAGPFDAELPFFEDWDLLIRLARAGAVPPPAAGDLRVPPLPRRRHTCSASGRASGRTSWR